MIRDSLQAQLKKMAKELGFGGATDLLMAEAQECAYVSKALKRKASDNEPGASRIGGLPDLPKTLEWPRGVDKKGKPSGYAAFLAQFNLADIPELIDFPLPRRGNLWVFMRGWIDDVRLAVIHDSDPGNLSRRKPPTKDDWGHHASGPSEPMPIRFTRGMSLPAHRRAFQNAVEAVMRGERPDDWMRILLAFVPRSHVAQVGGYSIAVEENFDLQRWVAYRRLGKAGHRFSDRWGSITVYEESLKRSNWPSFLSAAQIAQHDARLRAERPAVEWIDRYREELAGETASWRLLVSFTQNSEVGFGDGMYLDCFIRAEDLTAGKFDDVAAECPMVL